MKAKRAYDGFDEREFDPKEDYQAGATALMRSDLSPEELVGRLLRARRMHSRHLSGAGDLNDDGIRAAIDHLLGRVRG